MRHKFKYFLILCSETGTVVQRRCTSLPVNLEQVSREDIPLFRYRCQLDVLHFTSSLVFLRSRHTMKSSTGTRDTTRDLNVLVSPCLPHSVLLVFSRLFLSLRAKGCPEPLSVHYFVFHRSC